MTGLEIRENSYLRPLADLIASVDRPGSYCFESRITCPPPLLTVSGVGVVPFPIPKATLDALIDHAERAPFGRGEETVLDRSVRDTWQIAPQDVSLGGKGWPDTFERILADSCEGLGCPPGSLSAELHKFLIYEKEGFFAPHRDTEKSDGMVATLVISLPVARRGGELLVRHRGSETRIDLRVEDPSELSCAAFYADCEHEVRPVTDGHRVSLVFNLIRSSQNVPITAPDHSRTTDRIADWLTTHEEALRLRDRLDPATDSAESRRNRIQHGNEGEPEGIAIPDKLIWVLEHGYSEAGLSFDALKNIDEAVASTLCNAADRAGFVILASVLQIDQFSSPDYYYSDGEPGFDEEQIFEESRYLKGWVASDGTAPEIGTLSATVNEIVPASHLWGLDYDEQEFDPPTGNDGGTVERRYRLGALVLWPRERAIDVLAATSLGAAVGFLGTLHAFADREFAFRQAERLLDLWLRFDSRALRFDMHKPTEKFVEELLRIDPAGLLKRFVEEFVVPNYDPGINRKFGEALVALGASTAGGLLETVVETSFRRERNEVIVLLSDIDRATGGSDGAEWNESLANCFRLILKADKALEDDDVPKSPGGEALTGESVTALLFLARRLNLPSLNDEWAESVSSEGGGGSPLDPCRALPEALEATEGKTPELGRLRGSLRSHAAERLLDRSEFPPEEPSDWRIDARVRVVTQSKREGDGTNRSWTLTRCCKELQAFCDDPNANEKEFPAPADTRWHLERLIKHDNLDIQCHTLRKGSPHRLVCRKNRNSYGRRLAEYAADIDCMKRLLGQEAAPDADRNQRIRLREAVARGEAHEKALRQAK